MIYISHFRWRNQCLVVVKLIVFFVITFTENSFRTCQKWQSRNSWKFWFTRVCVVVCVIRVCVEGLFAWNLLVVEIVVGVVVAWFLGEFNSIEMPNEFISLFSWVKDQNSIRPHYIIQSSRYITFHHISSHHTMSHDMTWHDMTSRHITSHHITSHRYF